MTEQSMSIRRGLNWIGLSQIGKIGLQLASVFTLARILPSGDYGLMAMAATITAFAALLRDMGTGSALIQKERIDSTLVSTVFWFNIVLGIFLTLLFVGLASIAAKIFREPRLEEILPILSPVFFVAALGIVHQALLERESKFKSLAAIDLISGILALTTALIVAWKGGGVYALVAQSLVSVFISTILLWFVSRWHPIFHFKASDMKDIWHFSGNVFLFNTVNYFHRNADSMLIGRFLGATDLGFYNIAYRFLLFPLQNITFVISRVSFPVYSRNQSNKTQIAKHYLETLETIAFIIAPMMAILWSLREPALTVLLGGKWLPAADVIAWLAPVGFFQSMVSTSGAVLNAIGRSDVLRNLGFIGAPFLVLSFVIGLPWGVEGVAASYCLANLIWVYPVLKTVLRLLSRSFFDFIKAVFKQTLLAIVLGIFVRSLSKYELLQESSTYLQLLAGGGLLISIYLIFSWYILKAPMRRLFIRFLKQDTVVIRH